MIDIKDLTIKKAHEGLTKGDFSVKELTGAYLKKAEEQNPEINAYLEMFDDTQEQVKKAEKMLQEGKANPLTGIPLAVKDNILIEGRVASASSKILEGYKATYDSTVIKKLKELGAIFLGRTNMDEFAMGSSTENSAFGRTKNPKDLDRVPGGSSGGSAAAVAMDGALYALGSDTGGSIRQPASFCGVVGLKPTYGAVSRYGLMAMGSSLDQIGPLTKTVSDAEVVFNAIAGHDPMDSTSVPIKMRQQSGWKEHKKIGVPRAFLKGGGIDKEVLDNFEGTLLKLKSAGYGIVDIEIPLLDYSLAVYYILMPAEASTNLARFDGVRYGLSLEGEDVIDSYKKTRGGGFGKEVRRRIMLGTYVLSHGYYDAYYNKANQLQKVIEADFAKVFKDIDAIVTPTSPTPAFRAGEKSQDPLQMYLSDIFTVSANITGVPAISIPSGVTKDNLPLGVQFMASHFREDLLFTIGKAFELADKS